VRVVDVIQAQALRGSQVVKTRLFPARCLCLPASLHDLTGAEAALRDSARRLGAGKEKHQAVILADLSTAFVLHDDPEQACAVLHQVIDLVELTGSAAGKRRAFAAGRQLTRWRNEAFVQTRRIDCWHLPAEPLSGESC
jgi:hypothetical protein